MAFDIKAFAEEVNGSRLALEEGKLVFLLKDGNREEHNLSSEIIGIDGFFGKTLEWKSDGKKQSKDIYYIKSANGIQKSKYE